MNLLRIQEIIADQKVSLEHLLSQRISSRAEEDQVDLSSRLAQVVTGVRRSGKSTLCLNVLKKCGRPFGYVNFDDERLIGLTGTDLDIVQTACRKVYGEFDILFLDEPQNIPEWALFVNRLLRGGMHVLVTGSNSHLLGGELATHMTGRYHEIRLFPFSFREYCDFRNVDTEGLSMEARVGRSAAFDDFLKYGAFPEVAGGENVRSYVRTLIENIRTKDIERRYGIRYKAELRKLIDYVLNAAPLLLDVASIADLFGFSSRQTAANYVEYMERSFLVNRIPKYSNKPKLRIRGEKLYPVDVSFLNGRENALQGTNLGWRLETVVALELLRRGHFTLNDVYWFGEAGHECDFVVFDNRTPVEVIQVSYDVTEEKTLKREVKGACAAAKALNLHRAKIITYSDADTLHPASEMEIEVVPAVQWLLETEWQRKTTRPCLMG